MSTNRQTLALHKLAVAMAILAVIGVSCDGGDAGDAGSGSAVASARTERVRVVLDYSPTLSDAGALLYLASNPSVEVLAVTLPGTGEADCVPGTRTTRSLLVVAGQPDVPVGCGRDEPLTGNRDWPAEWRTEVNRWGTDILPPVSDEPVADAEQLLADTLTDATDPVTVVAVGPLTNVAAVLTTHPALADRIERIVIMGGAVTVPGNVEASPAAEWNIYIDPEAARQVIAADVEVTFVPLDATNHVPWTERLLSRLGSLEAPAAVAVHQMAASRATLAGFYLWDELAAMAAVTPALVTTGAMTIRIDDDGAIVQHPAGVVVDVAVSADSISATDEFMRVLNGGNLPDVVALTAGELDYMMTMNEIDGRARSELSSAFARLDAAGSDPHRDAAALIDEFTSAIAALAVELRMVTPPASLHALHDQYVDSVEQLAAAREQMRAAAAVSDGGNVDEVMADVEMATGIESRFSDFRATCQALEDYSFTHSGPRPCGAAADS